MHRLQAGEAAAVQHPQLRAELASPAICSQVLGSACLVPVSGLSTTHMMTAGCLLLLVSLNCCPGPSSFPHHLLNPPISVTSHLSGLLEPFTQGNMVGRGLCSSPHAAPPHSCTHLCGFLSPPRRHGDSRGAPGSLQPGIRIMQSHLWTGLGEPALGKEQTQRPALPSEDRRRKPWLGLGSK